MVPHAVRDLPPPADGAAGVGLRDPGGLRDLTEDRARHMGQAAGVSWEQSLLFSNTVRIEHFTGDSFSLF